MIDGVFECLTLEDVVREIKIPGATAIPSGNYNLSIGHSNKFKRMMPKIDNVPGFSGILIHWGNTSADTEGCILVGKSSSKNFIGSSKLTFNNLYKKLEIASQSGSIQITILDDR